MRLGESVLAIVVACMLLMPVSVLAIGAEPKTLMLNIEQGHSAKFWLHVTYSGTVDVSHSGDINNWISHATSLSSGEWLEVTVSVPSGASIQSYNADISVDGVTVTKLTVVVTTPIDERLTTINNKLNNLQDDQDGLASKMNSMSSDMDTVESELLDLQNDVTAVKNTQQSISDIQQTFNAEKQDMQARISALESEKLNLEQQNQELNDLTGMVTINSSGVGIVIGLVVGLLVAIIYFKGMIKLGSLSMPRRLTSASSHPGRKERHESRHVEMKTPDKAVSHSPKRSHERIRDIGYNFKSG